MNTLIFCANRFTLYCTLLFFSLYFTITLAANEPEVSHINLLLSKVDYLKLISTIANAIGQSSSEFRQAYYSFSQSQRVVCLKKSPIDVLGLPSQISIYCHPKKELSQCHCLIAHDHWLTHSVFLASSLFSLWRADNLLLKELCRCLRQIYCFNYSLKRSWR